MPRCQVPSRQARDSARWALRVQRHHLRSLTEGENPRHWFHKTSCVRNLRILRVLHGCRGRCRLWIASSSCSYKHRLYAQTSCKKANALLNDSTSGTLFEGGLVRSKLDTYLKSRLHAMTIDTLSHGLQAQFTTGLPVARCAYQHLHACDQRSRCLGTLATRPTDTARNRKPFSATNRLFPSQSRFGHHASASLLGAIALLRNPSSNGMSRRALPSFPVAICAWPWLQASMHAPCRDWLLAKLGARGQGGNSPGT
jgi:hypothetical protein